MTGQLHDTMTARRSDAGAVRMGQRDIDGLVLCAEHRLVAAAPDRPRPGPAADRIPGPAAGPAPAAGLTRGARTRA